MFNYNAKTLRISLILLGTTVVLFLSLGFYLGRPLAKDSRIFAMYFILFAVFLLVGFSVCTFLITWQHRQSHKKVEQIVYLDELSGIPNLRKCKIYAQQLINDQPDRKLLMVKFDIDQFKVINQTLGEAAGDQVLLTIADVLRQITAGTDRKSVV